MISISFENDENDNIQILLFVIPSFILIIIILIEQKTMPKSIKYISENSNK